MLLNRFRDVMHKTWPFQFLLEGVLLFTLSSCRETPVENPALGTEHEIVSAVLETDKGRIVIQLESEQVPGHVENFLKLCESGFYNGTYFHRVVPGYLIQGGDPNTRDDDPANDGRGGHSYLGPGTTLLPEVSHLHHTRGVVSMARSSKPESEGSQFFILLADAPELDGYDTAFGRVIEGLEVVEKISQERGATLQPGGGFNPKRKQYINQCRVEMRPLKEP